MLARKGRPMRSSILSEPPEGLLVRASPGTFLFGKTVAGWEKEFILTKETWP